MGGRVLVIDDSATIRKLVSATLARHGYVPIAAADGRAGLEKLRSTDVDLVLLDYSMPKMDGRQFCLAMRGDPRTGGIPVLLMSARASFGEELLGEGLVSATITKPFEPRALIEAVETALAEEIVLDPDEDEAVEVSETRRRPSQSPKLRGSKDVAQILARIVTAPLAELSPRVRGDVQVVEAVLARILGKEQLATLASALGAEAPREEPSLAGDLTTIALGEILQVLHFQRQTGKLCLVSGEAEVVIYLREGFIDFVEGRGMSEKLRLGRYLVEEGLVSRDELEALLRGRDEGSPRKLLGEMLIELGVLSEADVKRALTKQSSELIYELLRWSRGRFSFAQEAFPKEARDAKLGLPIASVVMEGFRRIDEWQLMEEFFDFDEILHRDEAAFEALAPDKLGKRERLVLAAIDGTRTAREVVEGLDVCPFDAFKILYDSLRARLLRRAA